MVTEAEFRTSVLPFTLHYEGGLSTVRTDPGNWTGGKVGQGELRGTKYGIAAASHPHLNIRNLTLAQASALYWQDYCRAPGFDRLALPLCLVVFDAGVMSGPARAARWLSEARRETALADEIAAVSEARLAFCRSRKTWATFGGGWSPRIAACEKRGLLLAAAAPVALPVSLPAPAAHALAHPKPATQPQTTALGQFLRVLLDALFSPLSQGAQT